MGVVKPRVMSNPFEAKAIWSLPISDEHFTEIGRLAAYWSQVEYALQKIIWKIVGLPWPECKALTAAQRPETHSEIIKLLIASPMCIEAQTQEALRDIIKRVSELKDPRNNIVHAIWVIDPTTLEPLAMKSRIKDAASSKVPYTPQDIRAVAERVNQLWQDINNLLEHISSNE